MFFSIRACHSCTAVVLVVLVVLVVSVVSVVVYRYYYGGQKKKKKVHGTYGTHYSPIFIWFYLVLLNIASKIAPLPAPVGVNGKNPARSPKLF